MDEESKISDGYESSNVDFIALTFSTLSFAGKGSTHEDVVPGGVEKRGPPDWGGDEEETTVEMQRWYDALLHARTTGVT